MIKSAAKYLGEIPAVFIDGALYVWIGVLTFLATQIGSDDAAKYIEAQVLFWLKTGIGSFSTGLVSLKMYRSTSYADHQIEKKKTGDTQFITKS